MEIKKLKFCYEKNLISNRPTNTQKAVWQKSKYWNKGQIIKVYFIGGLSGEIAEMKKAFSEIAAYTKLNFIYTTNKYESHIRVSFNKGWGSYSYLGTDALFVPKSLETINIGWRGMDVCRHEALHAIGALHEHQNPKGGIEWDEAAVIKDLSSSPNYWTEEEIRLNVLDKIDKSTVDASEYDPASIMLYYFPASWTNNGIASNDNSDFSQTDIQFMREIYGEKDTVAPVLTLNGESNLTLDKGGVYLEKGATALDNMEGDISGRIVVTGNVDTSIEGIYHLIYSVTDKSGNKSEKIRNIMVQTKLELKVFLKELFPTKDRLSRLTEPQLVHIAQSLDVDASVGDLKINTVNKIWETIE